MAGEQKGRETMGAGAGLHIDGGMRTARAENGRMVSSPCGDPRRLILTGRRGTLMSDWLQVPDALTDRPSAYPVKPVPQLPTRRRQIT